MKAPSVTKVATNTTSSLYPGRISICFVKEFNQRGALAVPITSAGTRGEGGVHLTCLICLRDCALPESSAVGLHYPRGERHCDGGATWPRTTHNARPGRLQPPLAAHKGTGTPPSINPSHAELNPSLDVTQLKTVKPGFRVQAETN